MRRYLVVAHKTLGGEHLFEHLHELRQADPHCRFHLVVPEHHPSDHVWSEQEVRAAATERLDTMLEFMAEMGMGASGEVGDADPVYAIGVVLRRDGLESVCGIVLSTLPRGISRWWRFDVPRRVAKAFPSVPLTHVVAEEAPVP
jgi:GABA permease